MFILGMVLLGLGVVLLGIGWNISRGLSQKLLKGVTGHFTQRTRWYFIGGIALIIIGVALAIYSGNLVNINK